MISWKSTKEEWGFWIFFFALIIGFFLFLNRWDILLNGLDSCFKENVKFWKDGNLQLFRSFLEHIIFNFVVPLLFVTFFLGIDRLFKKHPNWKVYFFAGMAVDLLATGLWEFKKWPKLEWIEIGYDLAGLFLSWIFINWMIGQKGAKK